MRSVTSALLAITLLQSTACASKDEATIPLPEPTRVSAVPAASRELELPAPTTPSAPTPSPTHRGNVSPVQIQIVVVPIPIPAFPTSTLPPTLPPVAPAPTGSNTPASAPTTQPVTESRVIVFGTSWCTHCGHLRRDLTARGVPHAYVDIDDKTALATRDGQRASEIPGSMRNAVPVTRVVEPSGRVTWVHGNDASRVEQAYRR